MFVWIQFFAYKGLDNHKPYCEFTNQTTSAK